MTPDDLAAFEALLDEHEQFAREASQAPWRCTDNFVENLDGGMIARFEVEANARFAAWNDPKRALAEVAADRALLDLYERAKRYRDQVFARPEPRSVSDEMRAVTGMLDLEQVLRLRAAVYA